MGRGLCHVCHDGEPEHEIYLGVPADVSAGVPSFQAADEVAKLKEIHHNVLAIDDGALLEEFGEVLGMCWPSTSSGLQVVQRTVGRTGGSPFLSPVLLLAPPCPDDRRL